MPSSRGRAEITPPERQPIGPRLLKLLEALNVVPLVFLKLAADYAVILVEEELRLERYCKLSNNFTETECELMLDNDNFTYVKTEVISHEKFFILQTNIIQTLVSLVVVAFAVSWSERHGRIPLLKLSIIGSFLAAFVYILFIAVEDWPVEVLLVGSFLRSIAGGPSLFTMATFSMMVDKTDSGSRTLGLGILTNMVIVGQATGYVAGLIVKGWGDSPFWVVFVALLLYIISMIFTIYLLKEDPDEFSDRVRPRNPNPWVDFIHPGNVVELFRVPFRKRKDKGRLHLLLILFVTFFVLYSQPFLLREWTTEFLNWSFLDFTVLSSLAMIGCQITTILVLRLTRQKPLHDCLLASIAEGMTAMQDFLLVSVTAPHLSGIIYLAAVFSITHNLSNVGIRAALSKLCDPSEIGRVFGIMAMQEIIMSWAREAMFLDLWDVAKDFLPTAQHLLSACFASLNTIVLLLVYLSMRKVDRSEERDRTRENNENNDIRHKEKDNDKHNDFVGHDNLAFEGDEFSCRL